MQESDKQLIAAIGDTAKKIQSQVVLLQDISDKLTTLIELQSGKVPASVQSTPQASPAQVPQATKPSEPVVKPTQAPAKAPSTAPTPAPTAPAAPAPSPATVTASAPVSGAKISSQLQEEGE